MPARHAHNPQTSNLRKLQNLLERCATSQTSNFEPQTSNLELNEEWPIECFQSAHSGPTPQFFNSYQLNTLSTKGPFHPDFERLKKFSIKSDFLIFGPVRRYPL